MKENHLLKKPKFSLAQYKDSKTVELINSTDQKVLALWAIDCAERVLHLIHTPLLKKLEMIVQQHQQLTQQARL